MKGQEKAALHPRLGSQQGVAWSARRGKPGRVQQPGILMQSFGERGSVPEKAASLRCSIQCNRRINQNNEAHRALPRKPLHQAEDGGRFQDVDVRGRSPAPGSAGSQVEDKITSFSTKFSSPEASSLRLAATCASMRSA